MEFKDFIGKNKKNIQDYITMSVNAAKREDYIQGGGGNTSVKLGDNLMAIKASGFSMEQITENTAYAVLNNELLSDFYLSTDPTTLEDVEAIGSSKVKDAAVIINGLNPLRPSVEAGFHSILGKFVLHSHSIYANLLSCSQNGRELLQQALWGADYSFGFVPYVNPGAQLTFIIRDVIAKVKKETGKAPSILLMENHGIIAHGDSYEETENLHHDANLRFAKLFNTSPEDFPTAKLKESGEGFSSNTPWLMSHLKSGKYTPKSLMEDSLYPDQLVFLANNIEYVEDFTAKSENKCGIIKATGEIYYNCSESEAIVIEQTLCCVIYITETIGKNGYILQAMDSSGKDFIAGWESEAYRKSLLK